MVDPRARLDDRDHIRCLTRERPGWQYAAGAPNGVLLRVARGLLAPRGVALGHPALDRAHHALAVRHGVPEVLDLAGDPLRVALACPDTDHVPRFRAHETGRNLVCRLLLEKKKKQK